MQIMLRKPTVVVVAGFGSSVPRKTADTADATTRSNSLLVTQLAGSIVVTSVLSSSR